jgi:hypothetical protein
VIGATHVERASHDFRAPCHGELVFLFDNSFSWLNNKAVTLDITSVATGQALLPHVTFVLGGPGAGKGTICSRLSAARG